MSNRDNFKEPVKRKLAERAGYKCSNPFCRITTIGAQMGDGGTVNIGEAAHICAAAPGGKRYDPNMTTAQREAYENGIWLCRTHAALIDRDEKYFTIKMLKDWKEQAERDSSNEILGISENVAICKTKLKLFYKDLEECQKWINVMKMQRGTILDSTCFPMQQNWEDKVLEMSGLIGADIASELLKILRELDEMKDVMQKECARTGMKRVADFGSIKYCNRYDLFMERMNEWLTDEFMSIFQVFSDI